MRRFCYESWRGFKTECYDENKKYKQKSNPSTQIASPFNPFNPDKQDYSLPLVFTKLNADVNYSH